MAIEPASGFTPPFDPSTRGRRGPDSESRATPGTSLVGAAGFEPATFGSQNRNSKFEKLNEVENLQRFRRSSLVGRLAHLAHLAQLAGFLYPDLTPPLSPPASPLARRAHNPKVAGSNPAPAASFKPSGP